MKISLSAIVVTRNEEKNIRRCLESLRWVDEIVVVDQSSSDKTVSICQEYTDKVFVVANKGYCEPDRPVACAKARNSWVLYLDADEEVSSQLRDEIEVLFFSNPTYTCYYVPRKNIFLKKWIRGSGWYPGYVLRLFKKGAVGFSEKIHTDLFPKAACGYLQQPLIHYTAERWEEYLAKSSRYTDILAQQELQKGKRVTLFNLAFKLFFLPLAYCLQKYILKKGFIDGWHGVLIAYLTFLTVFKMNLKLLNTPREQSHG